MPKYFATCARGLEPVLADELARLDAEAIEPGRGGVAFAGDLALLYRANLYLRTAVRVLQPILEGPIETPDDLYLRVHEFDWDQFLTVDHTLAVDANVRDSCLTHSHFAALRVKDAVCDRFRQRVGRRPNVDREKPMVGLNLHLAQNHMVLSLDSSGESLHKRGYRPILTRAPINEALATGLLLHLGWRGQEPLVDPMCGSGTFCIEGAWLALNRPPGLTRKRFGFMGWMDYDIALWTRLRDRARKATLPTLPHPILGSDIRHDAIEFCRTNSKAAGIGHLLRFALRDLKEFTPPPGPTGLIVCNPPYGERLGEEADLVDLYRSIGDLLQRAPGWRLAVFTGNGSLARAIGRKPRRRWDLFNGPIDCQLLEYGPG